MDLYDAVKDVMFRPNSVKLQVSHSDIARLEIIKLFSNMDESEIYHRALDEYFNKHVVNIMKYNARGQGKSIWNRMKW